MHAASTMKTPVLLEVLRRVDAGTLALTDEVSVKNEFKSLVDGSPFSIGLEESDGPTMKKLGGKATLEFLVTEMIVRSSNLATNLVLSLVGPENVQAFTDALGAPTVKVRRCVEDSKAFDKGLNNETDAAGMAAVMEAAVRSPKLSAAARAKAWEILTGQTFNEEIPAGLHPQSGAIVGHKTGSMSSVAARRGGRPPARRAGIRPRPPRERLRRERGGAPQGHRRRAEDVARRLGGDDRAVKRGVVLGLLVLYVVWGSTYLAIRYGLESIPPFAMSGLRYASAGAILLAAAKARGASRVAARDFVPAFTCGALLLLCGNGGVVWAEQRISSGLAALLIATEPLFIVLMRALPPERHAPGGRALFGTHPRALGCRAPPRSRAAGRRSTSTSSAPRWSCSPRSRGPSGPFFRGASHRPRRRFRRRRSRCSRAEPSFSRRPWRRANGPASRSRTSRRALSRLFSTS